MSTYETLAKPISVFYFVVAIMVALVLPGTYFLEDYHGEKEEVAAWAKLQAGVVNQAIETDPNIWPSNLGQLLNLLQSNIADDDDDETGHSILDAHHNILVRTPPKAISRPVVVEELPLYLHDTVIGYYRVERSLQGLLFETLYVAIGGLLLAFVIAVPLRRLPLRALHKTVGDLEREKEKALITLQSIGDAVITTNEKWQVEYLNPIAEELTGWTNSQAQGQHLNMLFDSAVQAENRGVTNHIGEGSAHNGFTTPNKPTVLIRNTDHKAFAIESSIAPIKNHAGAMIGAVMVFHDVTERRRAEELLRSSQVRANNALNIAKLGTFEWEVNTGQVRRSNRTSEIFEFYNDEGYQISDYFDRILPEDCERVKKEIDASLHSNSQLHTEYRIVLPSGGIRHIATMSTCERDKNNTCVRMLGVFNDITEYRNIEEQLKDADRRKDEFLAMLAHELRNPLAPISAGAELLQITEPDKELVRSTSQIIGRQAQHMADLINDLLDVSRVTTGLIKLEMRTLNLKDAVLEAIEQVSPLMEARRHYLELHLLSEEALVNADKKRLVQVIVNLLNNAAKYTPEGGHIVLNTEAQKDKVMISVVDNGIGIPSEMINHVFELFAQVERTPDRASGGLGLGLALVKDLVELHGGRTTCFSEGVGKGSTFKIYLPRLAGQDRERNHSEQMVETLARKPVNSMLRILVVDDNPDAAATLAKILRVLGHEVLVELDPIRALELARTEMPDVCILDIGLPGMDGIVLARKLRSEKNTEKTMLIALTGYGEEQDKKIALAAGFDHYLVKPASVEAFTGLLSK